MSSWRIRPLRPALPAFAATLVAGTLLLAACSGTSNTSASADSTTGVSAAAPSASSPSETPSAVNSSAAAAAAASNPQPAVQTGIAYAGTSPSQTLDLYLPANTSAPVPLVILIHGGAFAMGDSTMESAKAEALVAAGFAVASLNYRLSGEALFPAGAQDVKAAVRFLRAHSADYGIDPDRFAAWGSSAGGWLASMLGVTGDQATVFDDPTLGNADVSSALQAVVSWFGPTDFATMDAQAKKVTACAGRSQAHDEASSPESVWLGGALTDVVDVTKQTDLASYLPTATTIPPFYFAHGDADCNVPLGQSEELAAALDKAGATEIVSVVPGAGHADQAIDVQETDPSIGFLKQSLGG